MQADPIAEWQRLTEHYREMCDEELYELADDIGNLTETAQQVLRSEMKSRGLGETKAAKREPEARRAVDAWNLASNAPEDSDPIFGDAAGAFATRTPQIVPDTPGSEDDDTGPHEYTWKTLLCECETSQEAKQVSAVLNRAGIESWIEGARTGIGLANPRVLVAADQLEAASAIAAQPIPQAIIDQFKSEIPEFKPPVCPKCGASDPVLEGVNPRNTWRCEQCDAQWTEQAGSEDEEAENTGDTPL